MTFGEIFNKVVRIHLESEIEEILERPAPAQEVSNE